MDETKSDNNLTILNFQERRNKLKELIEEVGLWNINKTRLAGEWGISRETLYQDIRSVIQGVPIEDLQEIKIELFKAGKLAISESLKILAENNKPEIKLKSAIVVLDSIEKFTKFLENFDFKEKSSQRVDINLKNEVSSVSKVSYLIEKLEREGRRIITRDDIEECDNISSL